MRICAAGGALLPEAADSLAAEAMGLELAVGVFIGMIRDSAMVSDTVPQIVFGELPESIWRCLQIVLKSRSKQLLNILIDDLRTTVTVLSV